MQKIKCGDIVTVKTGKDKNRTGKVLRRIVKSVGPKKVRTWLIVEGINMLKNFVKANPEANQPGGIIAREGKIDISNVMLLNPKTGKGDKVKIKTLENGSMVRVFKSTGEVVNG